jgi:hypothetical protein
MSQQTRSFKRSEWTSIMNKYVKAPKVAKGVVAVDQSIQIDNVLAKLIYTDVSKTQVRLAFATSDAIAIPIMIVSNNNDGGNSGASGLYTYFVGIQNDRAITEGKPSMMLQAMFVMQTTGAVYEAVAIVGSNFKNNALMLQRTDIK